MKEILLYRGEIALVDNEDFDLINAFGWYRANGTYAVRTSYSEEGKKTTVYMHRTIVCCPPGFEVDHINRNKLDNRRENLRVCTVGENRRNTDMRRNNTSGLKGIYWKDRPKKWEASINVDYKHIFLGLFKTKEEAYSAYCAAAIKYHGEFASFGEQNEA